MFFYNLVKYLSAAKQKFWIGLDTWGVDTFADESEYGPERFQQSQKVLQIQHILHYFLTQSGVHTLEHLQKNFIDPKDKGRRCLCVL